SLDMLEGARDYYGLAEWELFRNPVRHPYWRSLGEFTPAQREKMTSATGLSFTEMTLAQQQRFLAIGLEWDAAPLHSLDDPAGAGGISTGAVVPRRSTTEAPPPRCRSPHPSLPARFAPRPRAGSSCRRYRRPPARGGWE